VGDLHRLIAFDLDGTLIDSRRDLADSANQLLAELKAAPLSEDRIGRMVGEGARVLVQRALAARGLEEAPSAVPRFLEIYDTRLLNHTRAYEGVLDAVRRAKPHARLVVLTNKPVRPSETILQGLGIRDLFDDLVGGDSPFGRKPDPAGLRAMIERAGATPDRTLMVGDSVIDHETAHRAGVQCCLTAYGYGFETFPEERLTAGDWVVKSTPELSAAIDRFLLQGSKEGEQRRPIGGR
jgi:phosphoglycolate phosphatase